MFGVGLTSECHGSPISVIGSCSALVYTHAHPLHCKYHHGFCRRRLVGRRQELEIQLVNSTQADALMNGEQL